MDGRDLARPLSGWRAAAILWLALPDGRRETDPAFEHHAELPRVALQLQRGEVCLPTVYAD